MEICDRIPKLQDAIWIALKGLKCKEGITYPATLDGLSAVLECIPDNFYDRVIHLVNESCQDATKMQIRLMSKLQATTATTTARYNYHNPQVICEDTTRHVY